MCHFATLPSVRHVNLPMPDFTTIAMGVGHSFLAPETFRQDILPSNASLRQNTVIQPTKIEKYFLGKRRSFSEVTFFSKVTLFGEVTNVLGLNRSGPVAKWPIGELTCRSDSYSMKTDKTYLFKFINKNLKGPTRPILSYSTL